MAACESERVIALVLTTLLGLFPFERIFEVADGVLTIALYLVGHTIRLQLGVITGLPTTCLTAPRTPVGLKKKLRQRSWEHRDGGI
jgi:hypothetical protein